MFDKFSQILPKLQIIGFSALLILIAVLVVPIHTLGFELPKFVVLSIAALLASLTLATKRVQVIDGLLGTSAGKLFLLYFGIVLISFTWSVMPSISIVGIDPRFQGIFALTSVFSCALFGVYMASTALGHAMFVKTMCVSYGIVVLYGVLQIIGLDPLSSLWMNEGFLGRVFSTLGHPNSLGHFLLLTGPFITIPLVSSNVRWRQLTAGTFLLLGFLVLFATVSRSTYLGLIAMLLACIPDAQRHYRKLSSVLRWKTIMGFLVLLAIASLFAADRFSFAHERGRSTGSRMVMWKTAVHMIMDRPWGYGLESMGILSSRFTDKELYAYETLNTTIDRSHSLPLDLLVTLGPLGFLCFYFLIRRLVKHAYYQRLQPMIWAPGLAILSFMVATFFSFPNTTTGLFFWMHIGFLLGLIPRSVVKRPRPLSSQMLLWSLVCINAVTVMAAFQWTEGRLLSAKAAMHQSTGDVSQALVAYQESIRTFRYDRPTLLRAAELHLHALEREDIDAEVFEQLNLSSLTLIDLLDDLTNGQDGMVDLLRAWHTASVGSRDDVDRYLREAKKKMPSSVTYYRTAEHIFRYLNDGVLQETQRMGIRSLLPDAYFEQGSELHRIMNKEHPWLKQL